MVHADAGEVTRFPEVTGILNGFIPYVLTDRYGTCAPVRSGSRLSTA